MTERWQEELRKLREVRPTADLDARIAEGPRPEPPPPTSRRVVAAITAFALFAAAGAFAFIVLREDGSNGAVVGGGEDPRLVLTLASTDLAPTATLRYGDKAVDVITEGYEWCDVDSDQCAGMISDFVFYPPVSDYLVVLPGTPIEVTGDGTVGDFRITDPDDQRIPGATEFVVPGANGRYAFAFTGVFERGEGSFFFGIQALDDPSSAPDVLNLDCSTGRTDTAVVRTQADGLHVVVANTGGFREIDIVTPEGTPPARFSGVGSDIPENGRAVYPVAPGIWEIGCFESARAVEAGDRTVPFALVDPDDHWAPVELTCANPSTESFTATIPSGVPPAQVAARHLSGLVEGDRLRGSDYDAGFELGFVYIVDRGGEAVARLELSTNESYPSTFSSCPDSGIALQADGGQPVPDVLVLRCEGLGPAVDDPTVRLQADGLHIEATNVADATVIAIDPQEGTIEALAIPFTSPSATESLVLDVPAGVFLIGCRYQDEAGNIVGGPAEFPDAYLEVTVLPVE